MLSWNRIYALILRHTIPLRRDLDLLSDVIYWPIVDVLAWGFASQWLSDSGDEITSTLLSILVALVVWNIIWRSQSEVGRNLMDELWNNNLINMFSSPLSLADWIASVIVQSIFKMIFGAGIVSLAILFLYAVNVFTIGWWMLPFALLASMTGWATGFAAASIVLRWGQKMQTVIWALPGLLIPFSAVYYPVEILPTIMQWMTWAIPTTYVFESMRSLLINGTIDTNFLWISLGLNIFYLSTGVLLFIHMFKKSKDLNLGRLQN